MTIYFCSHNIKTQGKKAFFSQWFEMKFIGGNGIYDLKNIIGDNLWNQYIQDKTFYNREQWMMLWKALIFGEKSNKNIIDKILSTMDPKTIKNFGRQIQNFDEKIWDQYKYQVVANGNFLQFTQNEELKMFLLSTKDEMIVEAAHYDKIWGIGYNESQALEMEKTQEGRNKLSLALNNGNLLGKAIMEVRTYISK